MPINLTRAPNGLLPLPEELIRHAQHRAAPRVRNDVLLPALTTRVRASVRVRVGTGSPGESAEQERSHFRPFEYAAVH